MSRKLLAGNSATPARISPSLPATRFVLSWSHYVLLVRRARSPPAKEFYEAEAIRCWTVRQLERQLDSQFYERTALSRNKAAMLKKGAVAKPEDATTPEEEIKDPLILEFLGLRDEYSESDLEDALITKLEYAGQMHLDLNYAREHWMVACENSPVGLILCTSKEDAVARCTLEGLPAKS